MALDNQFGKGIGLAAGFDLGAQKPLDSRVAVNTIAERDAHVTENRAYEGMLVYVAEANMTYQLVKGEEEGQLVWKEFGFNQADFDGAFADSIQDVDDRLKAVEEDLAQGGETEGRIAQAEADIDALQGLVGNPADADNEATGLHLALDNAKAELGQAIVDEKGRAEGQEAAIRQEMADALGNYSVEADENGEGGVEAAGLRKEIEEAHAAMNQALADEAAAIRQENADETARVNQKIADDIAAESALRVAEEQRIEKALEDEAAAIRGEMAEQHAAMDKALEDEAAAIRQEMADEAARVNQKIADDIAAESALRVAEEQRIEEVLNQEIADREEAIQELADRHDEEMDAAEGRLDVLEGLVGKPAVEGDEPADATGLHLALDEAKAELNQAIVDEAAEARKQEGLIRQELADEAAAIRGEVEELHEQLNADIEEAHQGINQAIADEQGRAEGKEAELLAAINAEVERADAAEKANKAVIDKLDGAVDVEGSVKKQIKDAVDALQGVHDEEMDAAEARIKANEDALAVINGEEEGSIKKALADAKKHADDAITALVDSAPDAMNTLNELAEAIKGNKDIYDAYIDEHAQAMAQQKTELQAEIDADVKVVADELDKQKDAAQEGTLANQIQVEKGRAEGQEAAIRQEMADALGNYSVAADENGEGAVEAKGLRKEIEEAHVAMNQGLADEAAAIRQEMADEAARVNQKIADDIAAENALRVAEEAAIRQEMADEAARVNQKIADDIAAESALRVAEEQRIEKALEDEAAAIRQENADEAARVNQKIADDIAAESALRVAEEQRIEKALEDEAAAIRGELDDTIAKEVEDRDAAILVEQQRAEAQEAAIRGEFAAADAALHAQVKAEMAAVIQSLQASITDDGKLRLALGGIEGDDVLVIKEQEIPFVTDEDIDAIIAGLDAE